MSTGVDLPQDGNDNFLLYPGEEGCIDMGPGADSGDVCVLGNRDQLVWGFRVGALLFLSVILWSHLAAFISFVLSNISLACFPGHGIFLREHFEILT